MDYAGSPFEIKSIDDAGRIEGLAAGFGDVDQGGDKIIFGAFTKTLADRGTRPLPMLHSHDNRRPIGAWTEWTERPDGLYVKGKMTLATRDAQEAHALVKDGAMTGLSIGYKLSGGIGYDAIDGARVLPAIDLLEASLVAVPMHRRARVTSLKAISGAGDIAELLRERGFSGRQAKAAAGAAWKAINDSTEEPDFGDLAAILNQSAAKIAGL